ncbi:MAG: DUF58 domain-containing protein [Candidatus Brocadiia bacterium]
MGAEKQKTNYLDPDILAEIDRMDLRARYVVEGFISGLHKSPYHGLSVEFAQHRQYVPGDDVSYIDWKVWARADRFYIKQYEEETNLECTILLDCSRSMAYGENRGGMSKFDYAATLAASVAYLLQQQQDASGLVMFDRQVRSELYPSSHPRHIYALLDELQQAEPDDRSDISGVFPRIAARIRKRGLILLISDLFYDPEDLEKGLSQLRHKRQEVVVFHVLHEDELTFPFRDNTLFKGMETEDQLMTEPPALRQAYLEALGNFEKNVRQICSKSAIDYVSLSTTEGLQAALSRYLASRKRIRHTYGKI